MLQWEDSNVGPKPARSPSLLWRCDGALEGCADVPILLHVSKLEQVSRQHSNSRRWKAASGSTEEKMLLFSVAAFVFGRKIFSARQQKESHRGVRRFCQGNVIIMPSLSWPCRVNRWLQAPRLHTSDFLLLFASAYMNRNVYVRHTQQHKFYNKHCHA